MAPSVTLLRLQALGAAIKATIQHFFSRKYPKDWNLSTHIQFAILRQLDAATLEWSIEDVLSLPTIKLSDTVAKFLNGLYL
jgi:hypothetical protein